MQVFKAMAAKAFAALSAPTCECQPNPLVPGPLCFKGHYSWSPGHVVDAAPQCGILLAPTGFPVLLLDVCL